MKYDIFDSETRHILEIYAEQFRHLSQYETEYPYAKGKFQINKTAYCTGTDHLTKIDLDVCINQLCYNAVWKWIREGALIIPIGFKEFLNAQKYSMFIVDSQDHFRKRIRNDEEIELRINLENMRRLGPKYLMYMNYDVDNKAIYGNLRLVYAPNLI